LIEIINKQLLLQLVGYLCYWQMGFNSVFKGLTAVSQTVSHYMLSVADPVPVVLPPARPSHVCHGHTIAFQAAALIVKEDT